MYFEVYKNRKIALRSDEILGGFGWDNELMYTPATTITVPATFHDIITGREEILLYANGKCFHGIVMGVEVDKDSETMTLDIEHVVHEWTYRQISMNNAIKDGKINILLTEEEEEEVEPVDGTVEKEADGTPQWTPPGYTLTWDDVKNHGNAHELMYRYAAQESAKRAFDLRYQSTKQTENKEDAEEKAKEEADEIDPTVLDSIANIYADMNFAYPGWTLNIEPAAGNHEIEYVYSRQNKLDALTKTMELTPDLFWRVGFTPDRVMDIGKFGEKKEYIVSEKPSGPNNISIIGEVKVKYDFKDVFNLLTVYSDKSDSGMSSLTLREVYNDGDLQDPMFPCVLLKTNVNNERNYTKYTTQYPTLAPNNELEYAIIDIESVALEGGEIIESTEAFNDLSPFNVIEPEEDEEDKTLEVTDEDRIKVAKVAYDAGCRKLKENRRTVQYIMTVEELPTDLTVGDQVRWIYNNKILLYDGCSNYEKEVLNVDDWFYVTRISYDIGEDGAETDELTLEKYIRIPRDLEPKPMDINGFYKEVESQVEKVAETASKNKTELQQDRKQRRNAVVDSFGVEHVRQGDVNTPARFYVSISSDMVYLERFQFKLIIDKLRSTAPDATGQEELRIEDDPNRNPPYKIVPNIHDHGVSKGLSEMPNTATAFTVRMRNRDEKPGDPPKPWIDITPYLMAQCDGTNTVWPNGDGIFPSAKIEKDFDILQVASDMRTTGISTEIAKAKEIEKAAYKEFEIEGNGPFNVTLVEYTKYAHINR